MQVKQLVLDTLAAGTVFAVCAAAIISSPAKTNAENIWPADKHADAVPAQLPKNVTLIAEYQLVSRTVYCVPYKENAAGRYCSDQVHNFDFVKNPLVVPIRDSNPVFNPFMQP